MKYKMNARGRKSCQKASQCQSELSKLYTRTLQESKTTLNVESFGVCGQTWSDNDHGHCDGYNYCDGDGHSHSQVRRTQIKKTILTSISIDHIRCHSLKLKILLCDTEGEDELFHQLKNILVKYWGWRWIICCWRSLGGFSVR